MMTNPVHVVNCSKLSGDVMEKLKLAADNDLMNQ